MKNKYQRMDKKTKKEIKNKFYLTDVGKYVKKKLLGSIICAILCLIISIVMYIADKDLIITDYIYYIGIFVSGIAFIITAKKIENTKINEYVIKNKL